LELGFEECKVLVSNVDSQASASNGIIVQVLGEMSNKGSASHKFAQTFFLAEQPNGYYVLNDIFRFLKEDIDNDYEEQADPVPETFQPKTTAVVAAEKEVPVAAAVADLKIREAPIQKSAESTQKAMAPPSAAPAPAVVEQQQQQQPQQAWADKSGSKPTPAATPAAKAPVVPPTPEKKPVEKFEPAKPKTWAIAAGTSTAGAAAPAVTTKAPVTVQASASSAGPKSTSPAKKSRDEISRSTSSNAPAASPSSPEKEQQNQQNGFHSVPNRRENRRSENDNPGILYFLIILW